MRGVRHVPPRPRIVWTANPLFHNVSATKTPVIGPLDPDSPDLSPSQSPTDPATLPGQSESPESDALRAADHRSLTPKPPISDSYGDTTAVAAISPCLLPKACSNENECGISAVHNAASLVAGVDAAVAQAALNGLRMEKPRRQIS